MLRHTLLSTLILFAALSTANAHDLWLQTNTPVIRTGEVVHVDLRLGNHGNHHRDFKLAGRINLDWVSAELRGPDGSRSDIKNVMVPTASAEKEGYWTSAIEVTKPGTYCVIQQLDRVMNHGKAVRGVRTAKAYFEVADALDVASLAQHHHQQPAGLPFELVLHTCPFTDTVVGQPIKVQVLHNGEPISDVVVSFIPEGTEPAGEFDPQYDFRSDKNGMVTFTPQAANRYLIVAHHTAEDEKTDQYEFTSYASTLTLHVPNKRPYVSQR
ncbi:Uncharacterized conserved protein, contains GH25 family domain [Neorhodopirellula lusitana]|uniref:Uncharacterized conserved protein, contains GH25 family domain n=1 Tax=Neorhodopirellula lusitana TaxID=445327 RepID=A0ABY1QKE5_9BACT|nr:DUF4198 domain-containing protein [Neorhodopirellula lusitana]SMP73271.1 Uncharacterized conserved protein, contains GH25 family domain [Neorhodopirellula lusitana]